jgi:amino acid transporter
MLTLGTGTGQYAVGWFTLSLINAALAQTKGKSAVNWWIISLLLGPFCTLLIVLSDPTKPAQ